MKKDLRSAYSLLLFDADNTLFDFTAGSRVAFDRAMAACGHASNADAFAIYEKINLSYWKAFEHGEIPKEAIYPGRLRELSGALGITIDPAHFDATYKSALGEQVLLMPGAEEVLTRLHRENFRLFVITNGDTAVQNARFARSSLTPLFEKIFISETIGMAKPSVGFFRAVADAIPSFSPEKALVIGDSPSSDIRGAMNAGWDAVYYDPTHTPLPAGISARYTIHALTDLLPLLNLSERS